MNAADNVFFHARRILAGQDIAIARDNARSIRADFRQRRADSITGRNQQVFIEDHGIGRIHSRPQFAKREAKTLAPVLGVERDHVQARDKDHVADAAHGHGHGRSIAGPLAGRLPEELARIGGKSDNPRTLRIASGIDENPIPLDKRRTGESEIALGRFPVRGILRVEFLEEVPSPDFLPARQVEAAEVSLVPYAYTRFRSTTGTCSGPSSSV